MTSIKRGVEDVINHDPAIQKDLARDVINTRALARHLQDKIEEEASLDAIISAIRRYSGEWEEKSSEGLFRNCKINMKNDVVDLSLANTPKVHESLGELPSLVDFSKGEILRFVVAVQRIKIIADAKNLGSIQDVFPEGEVLDVKDGLSEIILSFPEEAEETPGVVSKITNELKLHGINIIELMTSAPELIVVVDENDALKSYRTVSELFGD